MVFSVHSDWDIRGVGSVQVQKKGGSIYAPALFSVLLVAHTIAHPFNDHRFAAVQHPVKDRTCDGAVVVEDFGPLLERTITGYDHRTAFISFGYDLEQQIRAELVYWKIYEFIHHQELDFRVSAQRLLKAVYCPRCGKGVDDVHGSGEGSV